MFIHGQLVTVWVFFSLLATR